MKIKSILPLSDNTLANLKNLLQKQYNEVLNHLVDHTFSESLEPSLNKIANELNNDLAIVLKEIELRETGITLDI